MNADFCTHSFLFYILEKSHLNRRTIAMELNHAIFLFFSIYIFARVISFICCFICFESTNQSSFRTYKYASSVFLSNFIYNLLAVLMFWSRKIIDVSYNRRISFDSILFHTNSFYRVYNALIKFRSRFDLMNVICLDRTLVFFVFFFSTIFHCMRTFWRNIGELERIPIENMFSFSLLCYII